VAVRASSEAADALRRGRPAGDRAVDAGQPLLDVVEAGAELAEHRRRAGEQLLAQALAGVDDVGADLPQQPLHLDALRLRQLGAGPSRAARRRGWWSSRRRPPRRCRAAARERGGELLGAGVEAGADASSECAGARLSRALRARSSATSSPVADTIPAPSSSRSRRRASDASVSDCRRAADGRGRRRLGRVDSTRSRSSVTW
jgi:hypothetical protein